VLYMRVIRVAGASTSASVTYLMPVVATVVGVLILGEHLIWNQPLGALIVLTGVAISQGVLSRRRGARPPDDPVAASPGPAAAAP
ncbi:DMT family transporter, partial [Actinoplanes sp. NPDC048791]|uniref:DMT family transporter n=1 Tax=Actinoplanes sp. NPDC048791 TaxID=3154623 RepID=UPI003405F793